MDRVSLRIGLAVLLTTAPLFGQATDPRPNILFIYSDDHASHALSAYDPTLHLTPNLDRIASEGALFTNSFVGNSICAPCRATVLTGQHSLANGVRTNADRFDGGRLTFPKLLRAVGYQTALIGKWHLKADPTGFDHWEVLPGQGSYYNPDFITPDGTVRHEGHVTAITTDRALDWLGDGRDPDKPFLLMLQHKAPHRAWRPSPEHLRTFEGQTMPEPETLFFDHAGMASGSRSQEMSVAAHLFPYYDLKIDGIEDDGSPGWDPMKRLSEEQQAEWDAVYGPRNEVFRAGLASGELTGDALVRAKYQRYIKDYLRTIQGLDDQVGRLLDHLDQTGLARNTIVIYSSDQGFYLGDRGWYDKRWMYEPSLRTPLLVRWPGVVESGQVVDAMVQNIDIAPTLCELAGVTPPPLMHGSSMVPLLRGQQPEDWRSNLYYRYYEFPGVHAVPQHLGIRTETHKLIWYHQLDEWELFDLEQDPLELQNLADDPAHAALREELTAELARLKAALGDDDEVHVPLAPVPGSGTGNEGTARAADRPPNVVLVFCDDLGYSDVGCFGARGFSTPNIDGIARDGIRFTDFHSAEPVCSASRASLLTGCYARRLGIRGALGPGAKHGLHPEETTLAEVLKARGYATGLFGKWHLGHREPFRPIHHGFDETVCVPYSNDMSPDPKHNPRPHARKWPPLPLIKNGEVVELEPDQSRFTTDLTDAAIRFVRTHADEPFFVYLAHPMPHVPLFTSDAFAGSSEQGAFGDVIQEIDHGVGRIRAVLEELGLTEDTLLIVTSDNGPWRVFGNHGGSNRPLRGAKGNCFEGGVRVPFVACWPGEIPAGAVSAAPTMTIDVLPTIAALCDAQLPARRIDGNDIGALLLGGPDPRPEPPTYAFYYHKDQLQALRHGKWKMVFEHDYRHPDKPGADGMPGEYSWPHTPRVLFDLDADIGETTDVSEQHPDIVAMMEELADTYRADLGDGLRGVEGTGLREPGRW